MAELSSTLTWLDGAVIAAYGAGMLGVGLYFSRRSKTSEDYMLGGRKMKPWMVGLSLFATLISTISYLAGPGEVIRYGPTFYGGYAAYPLFFFFAGWFLIPWIMKQKATSAYEMLEKDLGSRVRVLAMGYFLTLRLLWMSLILYTSSYKIMVPLMGWPEEYGIWICGLMGVVTVCYTSMGGLQAVVTAGVIQTCILLGGAVLTLVLVTTDLGGVSGWWPREWMSNWESFQIWPGPGGDASRTLIGASISIFFWYMCTTGSDQIAIQQYLSTRDAPAARRALLVSLITDGGLTVILALLGLALLGFYRAHPEALPRGETQVTQGETANRAAGDIPPNEAGWSAVTEERLDARINQKADQLFPHYILIGLPSGVSGLVLAAMLAAAMSSLASGITSASAVLTRDLAGRTGWWKNDAGGEVRAARWFSAGVGGVILLLSSGIGFVSGNLLEITYKTANLLVGPLFVPFFLVLFIRRATGRGALAGMIAAALTAVLLAYWREIGQALERLSPDWNILGESNPSFLWIIPGSFAAGVLVSLAVSFLFRPGMKETH